MPVSKSATTDISVRKEIDDLKKMVSSLTDTVKDLSKQIQSPNNTQPRREQHRQRQGRHYNSQQQRENIPRTQRNPQYQGTQHRNRGDISTTLVQGIMEMTPRVLDVYREDICNGNAAHEWITVIKTK